MTRLLSALAGLCLAFTPAIAAAHHKPGHAGGTPRSPAGTILIPAASHCPPGLAKKNPPCIPPGQARRAGYAVGDRYDGDLIFVDRDRYALPPLRDGEGYVRVGDRILRLDRDERIILDIVDLILN